MRSIFFPVLAVLLSISAALSADEVPPRQAEIEVRFVQISTTELSELALHNAWQQMTTNALHTNLMAYAGSGELAKLLSLFEKNGTADILSAPRLTTRLGEPGNIKVVKEIIMGAPS